MMSLIASVKIRKRTIAIVLLSVILALLLLYMNQYSIVLTLHGFNKAGTEIVYTGMDADGKEFRVLKNDRGDQPNPRLGFAHRNGAGLWSMSVSDQPAESGVLSTSFTDTFLTQTDGSEANTSQLLHIIYCGRNAVKLIPDLAPYLPDGTIATVQQSGQDYTIHVMASGSAETTGIPELLQSLGCIK